MKNRKGGLTLDVAEVRTTPARLHLIKGLSLIVHPHMIIHIKNLKDRKTFDVDVTPNSTADDVKFAVEKQCGVTPKFASALVFGGRPLKDGATLAGAGRPKSATLHLVLRLKTYIELKVRALRLLPVASL